MISQLNDGRGLKHPLRIDDQLAVLERIDIALDQQQVWAALDR